MQQEVVTGAFTNRLKAEAFNLFKFLPSLREHTDDPSWFSVLMIKGGEEFSCNGLIPVKSSCIDIIPVKELGPGGHVFPGRSSLRAVFTCISVRYRVQNIFVNCSLVHIKENCPLEIQAQFQSSLQAGRMCSSCCRLAVFEEWHQGAFQKFVVVTGLKTCPARKKRTFCLLQFPPKRGLQRMLIPLDSCYFHTIRTGVFRGRICGGQALLCFVCRDDQCAGVLTQELATPWAFRHVASKTRTVADPAATEQCQ